MPARQRGLQTWQRPLPARLLAGQTLPERRLQVMLLELQMLQGQRLRLAVPRPLRRPKLPAPRSQASPGRCELQPEWLARPPRLRLLRQQPLGWALLWLRRVYPEPLARLRLLAPYWTDLQMLLLLLLPAPLAVVADHWPPRCWLLLLPAQRPWASAAPSKARQVIRRWATQPLLRCAQRLRRLVSRLVPRQTVWRAPSPPQNFQLLYCMGPRRGPPPAGMHLARDLPSRRSNM